MYGSLFVCVQMSHPHECFGWFVICGCVSPSKSKKDGKDQESIQSSTTPDPGYHMGK